MQVPENVKTFELSGSTMWYDEFGILNSVTKKVPPRNLAETKENIKKLKSILKEERVCMLIDSTNLSPPFKEVRKYLSEEMPKIIKALALISSSPLGRMVANLFFNIKKQPYPVKMFNNEQEAREWLKQYL